MKKIRVVDFFCGCGGTSAGLQAAGMKIIAGIDIDKDAGATYQENFSSAKFIQKDIRKMKVDELDSIIPLDRDFPLLFSTCAPCQPFTKQNTGKKKEDSRRELLDELHVFVERHHPEFIFLENVPGIQKIDTSNSPLSRFADMLNVNGYSWVGKIVNSQDYGVPQHRKRYVLLASRIGDVDFPEATHGPKSSRDYASVWDWIKDLPPINAGELHPLIPNHRAASLSDINMKRIRASSEGGGRNEWPTELLLSCHKSYKGHSDVYGRMHRSKPATALTTRCISYSNGRYGHPIQDRAISVREAARIQTFPDKFIFQGNLNSMARQIGNAVPVLLACEIGKRLIRHYRAFIRTEIQ